MNRGQGSEEPYRFEWVQSPPDLQPYLNSLYILRVGAEPVVDTMPAYSGQMVLLLEGGGTMEFADGSREASQAASFQCPLMQSHDFALEAHTRMLGVSLNFRGWAALTGLPVDEFSDRYEPLSTCLEASLVARAETIIEQCRNGSMGETEALHELAQIVREGVTTLPERHLQVIDCTLDWLSSSFKPEIADLLARLPYSERQVQRLVTRFFGQPPVRLIRRYRAIRAATLLAMPELDPKLEAEIRDAFYDQAHMIKEIRHFTGRTPRRLKPREQSVVKDTLAPEGYSSVDLFGGNQDEELAKKGK